MKENKGDILVLRKRLLALLVGFAFAFSGTSILAETGTDELVNSTKAQLLLKPIGSFYNEIIIDSITEENGYGVQVSRYSEGPATISVSIGHTFSATYSVSLDYGVEAELFKMVSAKIGGSIGLSATTETSYSESHTHQVPAGKTGAIFFRPRMKVVRATYYDEQGYGTTIRAEYPVVAGAYAQGTYYVEYK